MVEKKQKDETPRLTAVLVKEIFDDEASRKKLIEIVNLQQKERFLHHEEAICRNRIEVLQTEIGAKHHLTMLMQLQLSMVFMEAEYKHFLETYGKELTKKLRDNNEKNKQKRKN